MQFSRQAVAATACALSLGFQTTNASAVGIGLLYAQLNIKTEHDITAGLDESTRRLIMAMPAELRKETVELIRQALPMLEKSTTTLLTHVDGILEKNINHLTCAGQAFGRGIAEEFGGAITSRPVTPVRDLVQDWEQRTVNFQSRSAKSIAIDYEDFLHRAGILACRYADSTSTQRIDDLRATARQKWRTWLEIENDCVTPAECLAKRYVSVHAMLKAADWRDVAQAGAEPVFAQVKLNPVPPAKPETGFFAWLRTILGPRPVDTTWPAYETELERLRLIQRSLQATTALRLKTAESNLAAARFAIADFEEKDKKAKRHLSNQLNQGDNNLAKGLAQAVLEPDTLKNIATYFHLAQEGNNNLQPDVAKEQARLALVVRSAEQTVKSADENIKLIEAQKRAVIDAARSIGRFPF